MRGGDESTAVADGAMAYWHTWGGRFHRVPEKWAFPVKCGVADIIQHWFSIDFANKVVPLKDLKSHEVQHVKRGKQNLSDVRYLMGVLTAMALERGVSVSQKEPHNDEIIRFSQTVCPIVYSHSNSRRAHTISWGTYVKKFRKSGLRQ